MSKTFATFSLLLFVVLIGVAPATAQATLHLTKTACAPPPWPCTGVSSLTASEGDDVIYCYELENTGDTAALNVIILDDNGTPGTPGDDYSVSFDSALTDEDGDTYADDLAAGATVTGSKVVTLGSPGTVTNTATAHGTDATSGLEVTDTASMTVTVNDRVAQLHLTKTACAPPPWPCTGVSTLTVSEGDDVIYCYELENTGDAAALNVIILDDNGTPGTPGDDYSVPFDSALTDEDGDTYADDLAAGATVTGSKVVTLGTPGTVTNTATAHGTDATSGLEVSDTASMTVTVNDRVAQLQLTKTACAPPPWPCTGASSLTVSEGDDVIYCYELENTGDAAALNVIILDDNGTPGTPGDDYSVSFDSALTDEDGDTYADDLAAGATVTGSKVVTLGSPGTVTNTATAHGTDATSGLEVTDTASMTVTVNDRVAELRLTKTVTLSSGSCPGTDSLTVSEGDDVKYCYVVENLGGAAARDVEVLDDNGTNDGGLDDWSITLTGLTDEDGDGSEDDLAPGALASGFELVLPPGPGTTVNTATCHGYDIISGDPVQDEDTATVTVLNDRCAALSVTKTVCTALPCPGSGSLAVDEGDTIIYCYSLQNTGNAAALCVTVIDDNGTPETVSDDVTLTLAGLTDEDGDAQSNDLAPGATASATYTTVLDVPGSVINTVYATATDSTGDGQVSDSDSATVSVNDLAAQLEVTKTVTTELGMCPGARSATVDEGTAVQYCYTITNIGTAAAIGVLAKDDNGTPDTSDDVPLTFVGLTDENGDTFADDLAPGASATATYVTILASPGTITNTVAVRADDITSGADVTDTDSISVTVNDLVAELVLTKTVATEFGTCPGSDELTVNEGTTVKYCFAVMNPGSAAAIDIVAIDNNGTPADPSDDIHLVFVGLTDENGDALANDLAPGASATATYITTLSVPGTITNTAVVEAADMTSGEGVETSDTVTVEIVNVPPTFHECPADITVDNDPGLSTAVVSWTSPTATDPSGVPPTVVSTHNPGEAFPVGRTTVTYTATDANGGSATCSFDVSVRNTEPPIVEITVPGEDDVYLAGQSVLAQWTATSLVGLQSVHATSGSGQPLDTSRGGDQRFRVVATDVNGLFTTAEVSWRVIYLLRPPIHPQEWTEDWLCIDHCLPVEDRTMIGSVPLSATYVRGEPVQISLTLCGIHGDEAHDCFVSLSVTRVSDAEHEARFEDLLDYLLFFDVFGYDPERGGYFFELSTWNYKPGHYDLWIAVNNVLQQRIRILIEETTPSE